MFNIYCHIILAIIRQQTLFTRNGNPSKMISFINNFDSNMVNELNLLLDNSHNFPLNENQIDFFAESIKDIFQKNFKKSFKKYTDVLKKSKTFKYVVWLAVSKSKKKISRC